MHHDFRIATFNIHKGSTHFNASFALHHQRALLQKLHVDVVFLQEVQDVHLLKSKRFPAWPSAGQAEFLADVVWPDYAYGKNSVYPAGHHGNALLSKFPIINTNNQDISAHISEQRGMLHCEIDVAGWDKPLHAICLHLGLFAQWRHQQLLSVAAYIEEHIPADAALIIAGDFNDWGVMVQREMAAIDLRAFKGARQPTFPSRLPLVQLDHVFGRGLQPLGLHVPRGRIWWRMSDHLPLIAEFGLPD